MSSISAYALHLASSSQGIDVYGEARHEEVTLSRTDETMISWDSTTHFDSQTAALSTCLRAERPCIYCTSDLDPETFDIQDAPFFASDASSDSHDAPREYENTVMTIQVRHPACSSAHVHDAGCPDRPSAYSTNHGTYHSPSRSEAVCTGTVKVRDLPSILSALAQAMPVIVSSSGTHETSFDYTLPIAHGIRVARRSLEVFSSHLQPRLVCSF
ncbi:hypothetical protein FA95DRAFT_1566307, partial [Auriscalpium vulgare]